jgi:hypothetical protein
MKKKMIQGFSTLFTHTTSIYHYNVTLADIIQSDNFPKGSYLSEESQPQGSLNLPRERGVDIRKKKLVKGFDLKGSSFRGRPT